MVGMSAHHFDLGFLVYVDYARRDDAARALSDGLDLFRLGDRLGIDSGWVRVHHHATSLSAPFPLLTAAGRETSRIRLGAGVIPVGFEDPLRFAEDAATSDLLTGGRLEVGLSSGLGLATGVRGATPDAGRDAEMRRRLSDIAAAVRGEPLGAPYLARFAPPSDEPSPEADEILMPPRSNAPVATPHSRGLAERLWYGAGRRATAQLAGELGMNLLLSTLSTEVAAPTLALAQAEQIRVYREAFARHHPDRASRVAIARTIVPLLGRDDREQFGEVVRHDAAVLTPEGLRRDAAPTVQWSPTLSGDPDDIAAALADDAAFPLADTLLFVPPTGLLTAQKARLFETVSGEVAPLLGWRPGGQLSGDQRAAVDEPATSSTILPRV